MSTTKLTFNSADQYNAHTKKEIIKNRALALLSRDPDKRQKHSKLADAMEKTMRIFGAPIERRLLTTDRVVIPSCISAEQEKERKRMAEEQKDKEPADQNESEEG